MKRFDIFEGFTPYILKKVELGETMQCLKHENGKEFPEFNPLSCKHYGCDLYTDVLINGKFCKNKEWLCVGGIFKKVSKLKCLYWWFTNNKNLNNVRLFRNEKE